VRRINFLRAATAAVFGGLVANLIGCGGGGSYGGSGAGATSSPVVGRWRLTKVQASGLTLNCPGSLNVPGVGSASCGDNDIVQYNSDGTFTATGNITVNGGGFSFSSNGTGTGSTSGTWQLSGNQLTVHVTQPPPTGSGSQDATATAQFSGQNMTLTTTQNSVTVVTTFVKA
jgi:hypothetical protein